MPHTLQPALIFQNNMVLQRQKPIRVWGTGPAGVSLRGVLLDSTARTVIGADRRWELVFPPQEACDGCTLDIFCDSGSGANTSGSKPTLLGDDLYSHPFV